ncbi:Nucleic acid-binding, OB-fold [Sesbania bispinosa]|nr:Nucleic acid-binding, OB-fold [Sesbania bispinosa]
MSASVPKFVCLKNIDTNCESCTIRVQVIRIWSVPHLSAAGDFISIDMVLFDSHGTKIQASLRHSIVSILNLKLSEGLVYEIGGFEVIPNNGIDQVTNHAFRLMLTSNSRVISCAIDKYTHYGFSPISAKEIFDIRGRPNELVDVVGVLTGLSSEKHYLNDYKTCTMMFLELSDHTGRVEVVVYDEYAEYVREYLRCHGRSTPIIVIQFVKILPYGGQMFGKCAVRTVLNVSRIFFNPLISEIQNLKHRYNINVEVNDGVDVTYLSLCDADVEDIVNIPCKPVVMSLEDPYSMELPEILNDLIGRDYLFMVEKSFTTLSFEGNLKVLGICCDPDVVEIFLRLRYNFIPDEVRNNVHNLLSTLHNGVYLAEPEQSTFCISCVNDKSKFVVSNEYRTYVQQRPLKRSLDPEFQAETSHQDQVPHT